MLDALSAPAGAEDARTHEQRYHDGLHEAMRRLIAGGLLPERAGQPVKALVHVSLADLIRLEGSSALMAGVDRRVRAQWAAHRAAASAGGSDGGAWLDGDAARAFTCDASVTPVVTGEVDPAALDDLVRLCVQLDKLRHRDGDRDSGDGRPRRPRPALTRPQRRPGRAGPGHRPRPGGPGAGDHRQGRRPAVGSGRAGELPAPPAARRPPRRAEPARWTSGSAATSRPRSAGR